MTEEIEDKIEGEHSGDEISYGKDRSKIDFYIELGLILILGVLIGVAVKNEANRRITIGFDDYKIKLLPQQYSIIKMKVELEKRSDVNEEEKNTSGQDEGAFCPVR